MRIKTKPEIWFNTMPPLMGPRDGPHAFGMTVDVQTDTRLPEGSYELEMRIKGPDGKEQTAVTNFEIKYAC